MYRKLVVEIVETLLTSSIVILLIYTTVAIPEQVQGASMEPSFFTGERILVERITKHFEDFETGDVVVLHPPHDPDISYIKRIIGVPGDVVKIYDCRVYILRDGKKYILDEPYLNDGVCTGAGTLIKDGRSTKLNDGEYMVLGDNRSRSIDSRFFGLVTNKDMVGKVVFRFWPLREVGYVK